MKVWKIYERAGCYRIGYAGWLGIRWFKTYTYGGSEVYSTAFLTEARADLARMIRVKAEHLKWKNDYWKEIN